MERIKHCDVFLPIFADCGSSIFLTMVKFLIWFLVKLTWVLDPSWLSTWSVPMELWLSWRKFILDLLDEVTFKSKQLSFLTRERVD